MRMFKFHFMFLKRNAFNIVLGLFFLFVAAQKVPSIIKMYEAEGQPAQSAVAIDLNGQPISIPLPRKHILVFWATWCGPCKVELGRINNLILSGEVAAESVLAVSLAEDPNLVSSFVREQKYLFKIGVDQSGKTAELYQVSGTPTILFIGSDQKVSWMTTGLSPSLEFRIRSFLKKEI
jgi:cytochrome c biogenesis protein CcmG/thiol:disulfide interchange protein DsbE